MNRLNKSIAVLVLCLILSSGCEPRPPENVYVPGPSAQETVTISVSKVKGKVGEPLILHASRKTRGYILVKSSTLPEEACWWRSEPPAEEKEVADNLKWVIEPSGSATFNVNYRSDHARDVVFLKAGKYKLKGYSAVWCPPVTASDEVEIEISE